MVDTLHNSLLYQATNYKKCPTCVLNDRQSTAPEDYFENKVETLVILNSDFNFLISILV